MRLFLRWQAILEDGGLVVEDEIPYGQLFTNKLKIREFRLVDHSKMFTTAGTEIPPRLYLTIHLNPNRRLIYRKRTAIQVAMDARAQQAAEQGRDRSIIVGWQETLTARPHHGDQSIECAVNAQCIFIIHEATGNMEVMDRFRPGEGIVVKDWERDAGMDASTLTDAPSEAEGGEG